MKGGIPFPCKTKTGKVINNEEELQNTLKEFHSEVQTLCNGYGVSIEASAECDDDSGLSSWVSYEIELTTNKRKHYFRFPAE